MTQWNRNVELRAITTLENGDELIQTGVWVRSNMNIDQIRELFENGLNGRKIDKVEFTLYEERD